ncbi:hypothetical protein ACVCIC_00995 [Burkholderia glumae]|uniref:hypothetical protein n=1 Tax=Burkholderia TaxID=32008 RepID=UPI00040C79C7|nr:MULTISPECIES: hypothetical protein [Burkholderia]MCM2485625.1 hypothetical protein [Burkholderia glumae]MCM2496047.1 hypothetical protein [Burkholderia glumae]MCM2506154.1 hypothetical protein [Burkholderia glumae]MCM2541714.1 hypothetical protein [Burkholderia glumae]MCM2547294.1 hypothetical protein [Burkholderia glumae]
MELDREEAHREEAWQSAWREAAKDLGLDSASDDPDVLQLIWDEAEKLMESWRVPMPKSTRGGKAA